MGPQEDDRAHRRVDLERHASLRKTTEIVPRKSGRRISWSYAALS
jgi:hypothetical protein